MGKCDFVKPSVDFLKINEQTKKEDKTIKKDKAFNDPETEQAVDVSKYCTGFYYAESVCYQKCQDICPGTINDFKNYKSCPACDDIKNKNEKENCLKEQPDCIKEQLNSRACTFSKDFKNFGQCMNGCRQSCTNFCETVYSCCADDLKKCQDKSYLIISYG